MLFKEAKEARADFQERRSIHQRTVEHRGMDTRATYSTELHIAVSVKTFWYA